MKEKTLNVEELVLAPETTKSASINVEENLNDEKYAFLVSYTPNYKDLLVIQLHSIGCLIKNTSDEFNAIIIKGTMAQLEVLKGLEYVERVEINTTNTFEESSIIAKQLLFTDEEDDLTVKTSEKMDVSTENSLRLEEDSTDVSVMATSNGLSMSTAIPLTVATWKNGVIDCPCDVKWYKFTANASEAHIGNAKGEYTIYTSGSLDTIGRLYDSNGNQIGYSDDLYGNLNFSITAQLTYGATYYVKVNAYSNNTGSFRIVVGYTVASEFMPGAIPITLNSWKSGRISCPCDEVWYKLNLNSSSGQYYIYTKGNLDTMGYLYNNSGGQMASNDDAFGSTNFGISTYLSKGNTYYIRVKAYSSNVGSYELLVTDNIPVECVRITYAVDRLDIGQTANFEADVFPAHATNDCIIWTSSNTSVASIGTYTGKVSALSEGITIIKAQSFDGGCSDSIMLEVKKEFVTIKRDEDNPYFNKMIFETSNKIWYCMDLDMIFNESNHTDMKLERADLNVWDECGNLRQYSSEEMKLIYAIDPHGFAYYVKERAETLDGLANTLNYKDQIYELLFNKEPLYFRRNDYDEWVVTEDKSDLTKVMSESETLFGAHPIWDIDFFQLIVDVFSFALDIYAFTKGAAFFQSHKTIDTIIKILSFSFNILDDGFLSSTSNSFIDSAFENTDLDWVYEVISTFNSLYEISDGINLVPNYYREMFDYYITELNYDIYIELSNGNLCGIKDIRDLME